MSYVGDVSIYLLCNIMHYYFVLSKMNQMMVLYTALPSLLLEKSVVVEIVATYLIVCFEICTFQKGNGIPPHQYFQECMLSPLKVLFIHV